MSNAQMREILLNALRDYWIENGGMTIDEYMDCVRQVKERFND